MEVQQQYGDNVTFVGVPGSNNLDSVRDFVEDTGTTEVIHVSDPDGALWEAFDVRRRQTYVLVNANGVVEQVDFGDLTPRISALS